MLFFPIEKVIAETPSTITFHFQKPEGFTDIPGQFMSIELPTEHVPFPNNKKNFSLASSPTEDHLQITWKHGISDFKKYCEVHFKVGFAAPMTGPHGKFVLNEDPNVPLVMIAGGIGVTPFRAMSKYVTDKKIPKSMTLLYSNKTADDIPFKSEFDTWMGQNLKLKVVYTVTQANESEADKSWTGKRGRIDEAMIREVVGDIQIPEYMVVGPPKMVIETKGMLKQMGIDPQKIHIELFTGY